MFLCSFRSHAEILPVPETKFNPETRLRPTDSDPAVNSGVDVSHLSLQKTFCILEMI